MDKIFTSLLLGLLAFVIQLPAQAPTFTINPQSTSAQMGGTVTVDVEVSNFTNILSTQYAVKWDPSILQFADVTDINDGAFAGLSSSISTPGGNVPAGQVTVSWFNPSFTGIDLSDGTLVFTLELTAIGCGTSDITFEDPNDAISIEVLTGTFVDVGLTPENGTATVTGMDCGGQPADVSFTIADAMVEGGENFCLEVSVDDFTDLTDAELSINYNQSALSFASISNINLAGLSQANFNTSTPGQITMDWSNAATTVADGTVIFEICFQAVLVGNTDVTFSDTPLAISVTDTDGMDVNFNGTDGTVTVMPPDTGGGTLIVDIEDASVMQGENFCVSVTVDNFDDVVGMAFTLNYNASQLQYVEATNFNSNLFLFGAANVANPQAGFITVNYFNNNLTPTDLPDGAVLFDICFEAIAGGTSAIEMTSDITQIEFSDSNQAVIASDDNPGVIDVSGGSTDLIVDIENASVDEGENFCVSVTVDNFTDVVGMAFTLNYDDSQLQYVEATNFNSNLFLFGAANVANPQPGFITVNYFNNNLDPTDLPNGAVLFDICFEAIDAGTSTIEMTSDITQIEFSDSNQAVIPADDNPGSITVMDTGGNTDLIVDIENASVTEGDNFCVSVTVDNFTDVVGMAFTLNYNASQLEYVEATNFNSNLFLFGAANVANPQPGFITVNYFNNNLDPTDLPNGAVLFDICFEAIDEGSSLISMTSDITQIEFSDSNQAVISADDDPGSINIDPGITTTDLFLTIEDTSVDPGDNFCLEITTLNYSDVVGMAFTVTYDPNQLQYIDATNFNSNVTLFGAANVANPQPGFITVNYFENNLNPINLADGSVLFELCFEALGSGSASDLHITSDITQIEFSDSNQDVIDFSYEEGTVEITGVFTDLRLTAEDLTVPSTEPFCAEITVENFEDIVGMAFTLNYDATHLQFQQATNFNTNLPLFGSANVANPQAGFITVNYFENNLMPTTLNDGDVLFEVCFLPLGADGTCSDLTFTSDITQIEFSDSNQDVIAFFSEEGTICLDDATPGVVGLEVGDATVDQGDSFCVPVTTDNFIDVAAMSFTMVYDASHIELTGISSITGSLPGLTNASFDSSTPGVITVEWDGTSGVDLPDNTTLFELCFNAIGMAGTNSDIDFNSSVVPISLEDSNQDPLTLDATEGTVMINPEFDGFLLTIADETIEPGESFCVPVTVLNYTDIIGAAFTINYDASQLQFQQVTNLNTNLPDFNTVNIGTPPALNPGFITVNYLPLSLEPQTLVNGEVFFEICFVAIGDDGDESDICFSSDITPIEISIENDEVIEFNGECGTINISAAQPPQIVDADVVNVDCAGEETGSISLTIGGGEGGPFTYSWTHNGSPISDNTANLTDLASGTYNVTVTDQSTNLEASATYTIFAPSTSITINGGVSPPSCEGGCDGMITINVSGGTPGVSGYSYLWTGNITTPGLSGLCVGTYTVTVTDANGCQETRTFNVPNGIGTPINIDANVGAVSCNGENDGSISLIVSGANGAVFYNWSNPPGGMGSSKTNLAAGDYNVTVTDSNSCRNSATITVPEPDEITLTETVTDVLCVGEATGSITVTAEGGNGGFSYDWSDNLPSGPTVTGLDAGSYTVTASDSEGCFTTETYLVGEPPVPFAFVDAVANPIDLGNDGAITLNLEGGNPPYDVVWTPPTGPTVNSQNLINLNEPGTYCFEAEDENGCTLTGCVDLLMTLRISNFIIVDACAGEDNGSVTITVDGGVSPYTYQWNPVGATPSIINQGPGTVTVTVTDANNESLTAEFEIGESPQMVIDYELVPVTGNSANTNGSISLMMSGGTQPLSYLWDNGETTAEITNLATGTYCVTITDSNFDNNCAVDTCFDVFYSDPLGPPQITTVNTSCSYTEDGAVTIEIPGGVAPFTITLSATGMADIVMGPTTDNIIVQNGLAPGNYNVAIVDNLGQTQDTNITVEAPTALAYNYDSYQNALIGTCDGTIDLNVTGGTPGYTVTWDNGGGSGMQPNGLCGDIWYTPTIIDANGCEIQETIDAIYISNFGVEVVDITDTDCPEDENGAVDISVLGGDPNYQFIWQNSQGQTISMVEDIEDLPAGTYTLMVVEGSGRQVTETIEINTNSNLAATAAVMSNFNGFNVSCADSANGILQATASGSTNYSYEWVRLSDNTLAGTEATITDATAGDYELTVIDGLMCTTTAVVSVSAPPALQIQANVKDVTCADRTDGAIQAAASGGVQNLSYTYSWDNGVFGNQQFNIAEGSYGLTVTDFNNCTAESVFVVAAPDPITITFESEPATEGCNGSLLAQVNGGTEPYQYNWMNIDGANGAEALDLCPTINSNSEYLLQIIDANGCLSSITPAEVGDNRFPCLDERVVITPDGNGTNDEFIIFCVNDYPENHLEIYNRWGVAVFVGDNYDNTWAGTDADGNPLPEGPYYYILEYVDPEGNTLQQKGSLTILRDE